MHMRVHSLFLSNLRKLKFALKDKVSEIKQITIFIFLEYKIKFELDICKILIIITIVGIFFEPSR